MSEETVKAEGTATAAEDAGLSDDRTATSETPVVAPQQSEISEAASSENPRWPRSFPIRWKKRSW